MSTVQVPVLKDGDFVLTESVAMLRYLAREKQVESTFHVPGPTHLDLEVQLMSPDYFWFSPGGRPLVPEGESRSGKSGRILGVAAPGHKVHL